jgi:hypothetical protein
MENKKMFAYPAKLKSLELFKQTGYYIDGISSYHSSNLEKINNSNII